MTKDMVYIDWDLLNEQRQVLSVSVSNKFHLYIVLHALSPL